MTTRGIWINDETLVYKEGIIDYNDENNTCLIRELDKKVYDDIEDLTKYKYINDASLLEIIHQRYNKNKIYTQSYNILIAINPYNNLPLYTPEIQNSYISNTNDSPHPYKIAIECLNQLKSTGKSQSILISGESGAGKTVTCKIIAKFLCDISHKSDSNGYVDTILIDSNRILEAFGNSKTINNDNSSRFGKYIHLYYEDDKITHAHIDTYLLEKNRILFQEEGEQSFHILDTLQKGLEIEEELLSSFHKLGFDNDTILNILNLVKTVLYIVSNKDINEEISKYLQIPYQEFRQYIENDVINVMGEKIIKKRDKEQQVEFLHTLAKNIYSKLFDYIIEKINSKLHTNEKSNKSIGILDIFGFEVLKNNSLEQVFINYTNECLQGLFNEFVFKQEQKEYEIEGIDWSYIEFPSNDDILNLFDKEFYPLLEEQSIIPAGSSKKLYGRLNTNLKEHPHYSTRKLKKFPLEFFIEHYAGEIQYNADAFLEKNGDKGIDSSVNMLVACQNPIIQEFNLETIKRKSIKNATVSYEFRKSLNNLITKIKKCNQHYVRCIKPNNTDTKNNFVRKRVYEQLNYNGVLETIKIYQNGYPIRFKYNEFYEKYHPIFNNEKRKENIIELLGKSTKFQLGETKVFIKNELFEELEKKNYNKILKSTILLQKIIRGYITKCNFIKKYNSIIKIQSWHRMLKAQKLYLAMRKVFYGVKISNWCKTRFYNKKFNKKRIAARRIALWFKLIVKINILKEKIKNYYAAKIQAYWRYYIQKTRFNKIISSAIKIQSAYRMYKAVQERKKMRLEARNVKKLKEKIKELNKNIRVKRIFYKAIIHLIIKSLKEHSKIDFDRRYAYYEKQILDLSNALLERDRDNSRFKKIIKNQRRKIQQLEKRGLMNYLRNIF
jgi:myosin heavy subunit